MDRSGRAHLESVTEDYLYDQARRYTRTRPNGKVVRGRAFKWVPTIAGVPDRVLLLPFGIVCFIELKQEGEKPTMVQRVWHERLRDLGFRVEVIDSKAGVDALIADLTSTP